MQNNNQSPKPNNRHKNPPKTKRFRSELRKRLMPAEATLWKTIKNGQVDGLMFRRQFGVDMYILDFYCPEIKLAIERGNLGTDFKMVNNLPPPLRGYSLFKKEVEFPRPEFLLYSGGGYSGADICE